MVNVDEWDAAEQPALPKISNKEAAIALARSLGDQEAVAVFESAAAVGAQGELSIILPPHHLESLSRGRGWARQGKNDSVTWGRKVEGGYRVNKPGKWHVGGHDGFSRKRETEYTVRRVMIGELFWIVAHAS